MSILSPIAPDTSYFGMEPAVVEAQSIVQILCDDIGDIFGDKPDEKGRYVLTEAQGARLFFLSGLAYAMSNKVRDSYYVAHENDMKAKGKRP